jgi:hypothetical protein
MECGECLYENVDEIVCFEMMKNVVVCSSLWLAAYIENVSDFNPFGTGLF